MPTRIVHAETGQDLEQARTLMREYIAWTRTFVDDPESAPTFHNIEQELQALPGPYAAPRGRLLLALHDEKPAGIVALKPVDAKTGELKRLYVRPDFRGKRAGQQLVEALVAAARSVGYEKIVLDSHRSMTSAHRIYREAGFREVEAPLSFPGHLRDIVVFMEKGL